MSVIIENGRVHIKNNINSSFINILKNEITNPFSLQLIKSDYQIGIEFEFYILNNGTTANERIDNMNENIDSLLHQLSFFNEDIIVIKDSFEDDKNLSYSYLEKDNSLQSRLGEGFEFVSPKMNIKDVSFYLKTTADIINSIGFSNDSCGLHFHISSDKLKDVDMAKLLTFLHAEDNLFGDYVDRNQYVKSLEKVFLNSDIETFNVDIKEQSKQYDIVFLSDNHIELRVFGGANVYRDIDNILSKLNRFLEIHRISCMPNAEQELYKNLVMENISNGHHSLEKADMDTLMRVSEEIQERFGYNLSEAFEEAYNICEETQLVPQSLIEEFEQSNSINIHTI